MNEQGINRDTDASYVSFRPDGGIPKVFHILNWCNAIGILRFATQKLAFMES